METILQYVVNYGLAPILLTVFVCYTLKRDAAREKELEDFKATTKKNMDTANEATKRTINDVKDRYAEREKLLMSENARREEMIRNESDRREKVIREEASKRENILMANLEKQTSCIERISESMGDITRTMENMEKRLSRIEDKIL